MKGTVLASAFLIAIVVFVAPNWATLKNATPEFIVNGDQNNGGLGSDVGSAGDVNGDGFSDIAIGAPDFGESNNGRAFINTGSSSGLNATPVQTIVGNQARSEFGLGISSAGDVNGDGLADLIVGAFAWNGPQAPNAGRAELYFGSRASNP
jgi:hypothetical protein